MKYSKIQPDLNKHEEGFEVVDITTTYESTLPDSHLSYLFQLNDIKNPSLEDYIRIDLLYPYMMFYKIYSETEAIVLESHKQPFEIKMFLGEGYVAESYLESSYISIRSLKNRELEYFIDEIEKNPYEHYFFDLLDWLDERIDQEPDEVDFIKEYINSYSKNDRKLVRKILKEINPEIREARRFTNRKLRKHN